MAGCRSSGLPPQEAPVMIAEKRKLFFQFFQVAEAKEAGAAGIIGVIANVLGNGSPIMSSFAAAIGLDAPVEVCPTHIACMSHSACLVFASTQAVKEKKKEKKKKEKKAGCQTKKARGIVRHSLKEND